MSSSNYLADWLSRAASIVLVVCLISTSTPAAPQTFIAVAKESRVSFAFWFRSSGLSKLIQDGGGNTRTQETQTERNAKITRLEIFPKDVTIDLDGRIRFSAVAYDQDGNPVGGAKFRWSAQNTALGLRAPISDLGEFRALVAGSFSISAETNGKTAQVTVVVRPGVRRDLNQPPIATRNVSTRDLPSVSLVSSAKSQQFQTADRSSKDRRTKNRSIPAAKRSHTRARSNPPPASVPMLPGDGWDDTNYWSSDDPGNRVGDPPGTPMDGGAGSGNFQFAAPIYGSAGRGINVSLGAAYNSRLWNKAGNQITYDIDRGWPAPGWSLGFGKILYMGPNSGSMLVDADGTRHSYTGTITNYGYGILFMGHTTDGTLIDYGSWTLPSGVTTWGEVNLPNGTQLHCYAPGPGGVYPTDITDPNGNYITITYLNNAGPNIQTITDTLGRTITFYYDPNNLLTAITGPGLNGGAARTLVRFHYQHLAINYTNAFNGLTPVVRDPNPWVVDAIYYPATGTGYWFGDADSYSSYGMIARVIEQRGMTFSGAPLNEQGTVTQGSLTRRETYNYPLSPDSTLTDAPTYTSLTELWTRDGVQTDEAVTAYAVNQISSPRTTTITLPNGTKGTQQSYNHPGQYDDGLVFHDETRDANNTLLQSSSSTWQPGAYDSPRPIRVEKTDERGQLTAAEFSYGPVYNQVIEVRDYDYGGLNLLRATRTTYENSANYTGACNSTDCWGRHIFNLPLSVEVYAADNVTRVSRTEYQYDGQPLTNRPDVVRFSWIFDPYAEENGHCSTHPDWNDPDCTGNCYEYSCDGYCPEVTECPYNPETAYRGNVTQVTTYANATSEPATIPVVETRRYDVTGNLVTASTACCEQTSFGYTVDTQYAYPQSKTRGSATDALAQVTISATYDFNTGLTNSAIDANGRESQTEYDADTLRPAKATLPSGAHTHYSYDDVLMQVTATTYSVAHTENETAIADQNIKLLNGHGQVRQEKARGPDNGQNQTWDAVDTIYNNLGQVTQQSQPYRVGGASPVYSTATYDALGRTKTVTAPDGSVTETFYNEPTRPDVASSEPGETTLVRDAWGRERWGRTDASGRLVEVVEPNPNGNGSVATGGLVTTYAYNSLGNLTQTNQGAQTRSFKYDSLGRLTAQKLAEQSATLNDAGTYVGAGTWSDMFTYDERSNLTSRTDARGVKTVYSYNNDPLNRLQSVSWDMSGPHENLPDSPILPAAAVSYQYRQKANGAELKDITQLESVTTAGISTESYHFDSEGRVDRKTLTLTSRPLYPFETDYAYDLLDRVTNVTYPAQYLNGTQLRKVVHHDYDMASRLSGLTYDGQSFASSIVYNAASQTTSLNVGTGTNQIVENYGYNAQTGLLENQTVAKTATPTTHLLDLSYDYANANGKRTGQLTKILNNLNPNKDRGYSYDALGRLVQATGGPLTSPLWTQTYSYDRYGNRTSVSASGYSAKGTQASTPALNAENRGSSPTVREGAASLSHWERGRGEGLASNPSMIMSPRRSLGAVDESSANERSHHASRSAGKDASRSARKDAGAAAAPQSGSPTFTDDPLNDPNNPESFKIKALHLTELRTRINELRVQRGLQNYSWQKPTASGGAINNTVLISWEPIDEMRTALDQALGPPSGGYSAGLAQGQPVLAIHIQELRDRVKNNWNSSVPIPRDGHASLSYDTATNRITTAGFEYDAAGNQVRALIPGGTGSQRYQYDAASRLVNVKTDAGAVIASYTYGDSNERSIAEEGSTRTYYVGEGGATTAEYTEVNNSGILAWSKSYVYLGNRLLSTVTPNGAGGEAIQFHHPDWLGTRLVTDPSNGSWSEQVTLPFGTALAAESSGTPSNRRFTSYDRSETTKLDYAVNRHYDPQQGRFTQVDPAGMRATSLSSPQTLNLYSYCTNDPINRTDPDGLGLISFFKKVLRGIAKILTNKWVLLIVGIALGVLSGFAFYLAFSYATVNTTFLAYGIALAAMSALLIVGAFHQGFLRVVKAIGGITSTVQGIAGLIDGTINGGITGTPPWNPEGTNGSVSGFLALQKKPRRRKNEVQILLDNIAIARRRLGGHWRRFIEIVEKSKASGISTALVLCHASQESSLLNLDFAGSGFMETTIGPLDEVGLLQILPSTARELGVEPSQLTDVALNVRTGTRYLRGLIRSGGSVSAGLRAYKGPGPSAAPYASEIIQCSRQVKY